MSQTAILIKNKSGQLKTVDLNLAGIKSSAISDQRQDEANKRQIAEKKETETKIPVTDQSGDKKFSFPLGSPVLPSAKSSVVENNPTDGEHALQQKVEEILKPMAKEMTMPAFYFHREDEEEAAQYKNQATLKQAEDYKDLVLYMVEQIMNDSRVVVAEGARERLVRAMESRLREVRDLLETKEVLIRPVNLGGVGLDKESAGRVMRVIEEYRLQLFEKKEKTPIKKEIEPKETKSEIISTASGTQKSPIESEEIKFQQPAAD